MKNLNGEFDDQLEMNVQFAATIDTAALEAEDVSSRSGVGGSPSVLPSRLFGHAGRTNVRLETNIAA